MHKVLNSKAHLAHIFAIFAPMKYEKINLEDYILTGEGGTALSYDSKDGKRLLKLFNKGYDMGSVEREFGVNMTVFQMGLPTPQPFRLVTDGERYGTEYELIRNKRSFTRIISQEPEQLEPLSRLFARLAKEIHTKQADTAKLPDEREFYKAGIMAIESLTDAQRDKVLTRLYNLPSATTCLHGDLHIGNIITDGTRNLWIDVGEFGYGAPQWDLSMLYYATNFMGPERAENIFHLTPDTLKKHWLLFAKEYFGTESEEEIHAIERSLMPYAFIKVIFSWGKITGGKAPMTDGLAAMIDTL